MKRGLRITPMVVVVVALVSTICLGASFYYARYLLTTSLNLDFNVGIFNYALDLSEHVHLESSEVDLPVKDYLATERIFPFQHGDSVVELFDRSNRRLFRYTMNPRAVDWPPMGVEHIQTPDDEYYHDFTANGEEWRQLMIPLGESRPPHLFMAITVPREFLTAQVAEVTGSLTIVGLIGLVFLVLTLSLALSWLTLPIRGLGEQIRKLNPDGGAVRLSLASGPAEILALTDSFNELLERVQRLVRAEKDFTANAAHQLKTPLTIARGHLELLTQSLAHEEKEMAKTSLNEIDRLAQTIENLLWLSRIESGVEQPRRTNVSLLEVVTETISHLNPLAKALNRRFRIRFPENEPSQFSFQSDPEFLSESLRNLMENAIRYSSAEVIDVVADKNAQGFFVEVRNPTEVKSVPEDPQRRFKSGNHPGSGQGLGLAIASKLLSLLGSTLETSLRDGHFAACIQINNN